MNCYKLEQKLIVKITNYNLKFDLLGMHLTVYFFKIIMIIITMILLYRDIYQYGINLFDLENKVSLPYCEFKIMQSIMVSSYIPKFIETKKL